jgi:signal transduction histidine kinase
MTTAASLPHPMFQEQVSLSEMALQLNATLDLAELLPLSAQALAQFGHAQAAFLLLLDEKGLWLQCQATYQESTSHFDPYPQPLKIKNTLEGQTLKDGQPRFIAPQGEVWGGWVAICLLPMRSPRHPVGVMVLAYQTLGQPFDEDMLLLLRQLASHAAVAIENTRTYADSQARRFELAVLTDASEALNSTLSLPELLTLLGKNLQKALPMDWYEILLLAPDQSELVPLSSQRVIAGRRPASQITPPDELAARPTQTHPSLWRSIRRQTIHNVLRRDLGMAEDCLALMQAVGLQTLLTIPFYVQEGMAGIALLGHTERAIRFSPSEVRLAQGLMLQAANALKNAYLYADLQKSLEELRHAQAKLIQTARLSAMGELAAVVAHQINNPLTTILGDVQLLLEDTPPQHRDYASLLAIQRAGKRSYEVVRRLLTMARSKPDQDVVELLNVNLSIQNTVDLVKDTLLRSKISLQTDLDDSLPKAYGLVGQLEDVWLNLLLNARDALLGQPNPGVGIRSWYDPQGNSVGVEVWDNGPGISPEAYTHLFNAFYTTKPVGEGTGLGLYICATVVERCGGRIAVANRPEGGATFTVQLPCQPTL